MTDTHQPKKSTKKWIYIGIGLAILIIIAVGGIFLWKKLKNSNKSDSADQGDEEINEEELPAEIKQHRKTNWIDQATGLSNYQVPLEKLPTNISATQAKDELLEAFWQWGHKDKNWNKKKIERALVKNAQRINLADKKGNEDDPLFETKFLESIVEKYQPKNIFSSLPTQKKFKEVIMESKINLHFLRESFDLKYKSNKKIDWVASLRELAKRKIKNKSKTQQEEDFGKMTGYLEREYNSFVGLHINEFPSLNNLKELNQWAHTLIKREGIASNIIFARFFLGRRMGKKVVSPLRGGWKIETYGNLKNEKFGLEPVVKIFKA